MSTKGTKTFFPFTKADVVILALTIIAFSRIIFVAPDLQHGSKVRITGRVINEPTQKNNYQIITVNGIRAIVPRYPEIIYGDSVVVEGVWDNGMLRKAEVEITRQAKELLLYSVRQNLVEFYKRALPEPHSSLVAGVAVGSKAGMPEAFWESLKESGTAHVVVASGMNVTLVAGFLIGTFSQFINRRYAVLVSLLGIWIYTLISGLDAPIVRAAIMGSLSLFLMYQGMLYSAMRALIVSAAVMVIVKPYWISDLGFILSLAATLSLLIFNARITGLLRMVPKFMRGDLSSSISAQILVAPILLFSFGSFTAIAPLINAFVLWVIPIVTVIGIIAGILSLLMPQLATLLIYLTYPLTSYFIYIVNLFA